jgi:hypothetical protein
MSSARDAVLGNFNGPLCVVWKYGTVNDWQQWRTVNKRFKAVNDKPQFIKEWIMAAQFYLMTKSPAFHSTDKNSCWGCSSVYNDTWLESNMSNLSYRVFVEAWASGHDLRRWTKFNIGDVFIHHEPFTMTELRTRKKTQAMKEPAIK